MPHAAIGFQTKGPRGRKRNLFLTTGIYMHMNSFPTNNGTLINTNIDVFSILFIRRWTSPTVSEEKAAKIQKSIPRPFKRRVTDSSPLAVSSFFI